MLRTERLRRLVLAVEPDYSVAGIRARCRDDLHFFSRHYWIGGPFLADSGPFLLPFDGDPFPFDPWDAVGYAGFWPRAPCNQLPVPHLGADSTTRLNSLSHSVNSGEEPRSPCGMWIRPIRYPPPFHPPKTCPLGVFFLFAPRPEKTVVFAQL